MMIKSNLGLLATSSTQIGHVLCTVFSKATAADGAIIVKFADADSDEVPLIADRNILLTIFSDCSLTKVHQ